MYKKTHIKNHLNKTKSALYNIFNFGGKMIGTIFKCIRISQDKKTKEIAEILGCSLA